MKKIIVVISLLFAFGCAKEEAIPVVVAFDYEVFNDDFSVPVQVVFYNKTEGAEDYEWKFEGGVPSRSVERSPGVIQYNEKGVYTIELIGQNQDGSRDSKTMEIKIDSPVIVDFGVTNLVDTFSPATYTFQNKSSGATAYSWTFEGGTPDSSSEENPGEVTFTTPGEHLITLEVSNGKEKYTKKQTITVAPLLTSIFDYNPSLEDDDFEVPVTIQFENKSVSATTYSWTFENGSITSSTDENPNVTFNTVGSHTVKLITSNGKQTKEFTKNIVVYPNTNLREIKDIKLGINTAHTSNTIGSFYSIVDRKVYTDAEITQEIAGRIDIVFFGLNQTFSRNRFVSPDKLSETTFDLLENAQKTIFINSQELCTSCPTMSNVEYTNMRDDTPIKDMVIEETSGGLQDFDNGLQPRIVLFQTQDGRKGAIKVKRFVDDGSNSYILIDIKVQKESN